MKKLVREFEFSPQQLHEAERLSEALGVTVTMAQVLYARGVDTPEKARRFLAPSERNFLSPFLLKGMREAVELITRARDEEWRVAVFGDYDADGIGACAVLSRALKAFGIEAYLYIPERTEGYGMSVAAIDRIFDDFLPDLVITVDCGISNRKEVAYIREQGADVIVTDHHELPDELPDCIIVNPKLGGDYPYDNLCGAGVAFKLAQALIGEQANALVDFAALSTVADSVPLTGENRDIVAVGLKRIEEMPRPAFSALLGKTGEITAQTLAYYLAPRVNAAGRMGDAHAALKLFTTDDEEEIATLALSLNAYNTERQRCCDELYAQAEAQIAEEGAYGNVVMLAGEKWSAGFVGIVAARIAEEFARPTLLFVRRGESFKGSARSIENVNIFEALKGCAQYIEEFGGHAQAAGVNVSEQNFEALRAALNEYIGARYTREDFRPTIAVAGEGTEDFVAVAHELSALEPCGMGNRRPLFTVSAKRVACAPLKPLSPHLSFNLGGMDLVYFGGIKDMALLRSDVEKQIVFEYNVSKFRGKEYVKGFVRCVLYDGASGEEIELDALENCLKNLEYSQQGATFLPQEALDRLLGEKISACDYGLCAVVYDRKSLARYPSLKAIPTEIFTPSSGSLLNTVVFAPSQDCNLAGFREVVALDAPAAFPCTGRAALYAPADAPAMSALARVDCSRETLLGVFAALKRAEGCAAEGYADFARRMDFNVSRETVVFALAVFEELGLISTGDVLRIFRGKKTDLANSRIYVAVRSLKEQ